ncbi:hypothetical protein J3R30DRAFT_822184 [Lentinula aciculospora]|nr:hypothetical protein J3R30DRAFT_822184 [Lentinula aciculospora]
MHLEITFSRLSVPFIHVLEWTLKHVLLSGILLLKTFSNTLHRKDLLFFVLELTCSAVLIGCFTFLLRRALARRTIHLNVLDLGSYHIPQVLPLEGDPEACPMCPANKLSLASLPLGLFHFEVPNDDTDARLLAGSLIERKRWEVYEGIQAEVKSE